MFDTQTDRHFPERVNSCSGHPKACKSIKYWKSKIVTKPILSSIFTEESKNEIIDLNYFTDMYNSLKLNAS